MVIAIKDILKMEPNLHIGCHKILIKYHVHHFLKISMESSKFIFFPIYLNFLTLEIQTSKRSRFPRLIRYVYLIFQFHFDLFKNEGILFLF